MTELRLARKADAPAIHALLWAAKDDIPLTEKFKDDWYLRWVEDHCKRRAVWIVRNNDEIAGAMVMEENQIFYLVVSKKHRRKGIGTALIARAKKVLVFGIVGASVVFAQGYRNLERADDLQNQLDYFDIAKLRVWLEMN
jgi:GNAT superfamily N-acetyltransferase